MMQKTQNINDNNKLIKLASTASVFTAFIIIIIKVIAWLATDSLSVFSSLIDSLLDIIISIVNFFAVRYSLHPADSNHRFGHEKIEDIASFSQAIFIVASAFFITAEAIKRLIYPVAIQNNDLGIQIMLISSILTISLVLFQIYTVKKTRSKIIKADLLHYQSDLIINFVIIVSFTSIAKSQMFFLDSLLVIFIAFYLFKTSYTLGKNAFDNLMDTEFLEEDKKKIIDKIMACPGANGMHDLKTRRAGNKSFIQFHLEIDEKISLLEAHAITDSLEQDILNIFDKAEVIIHQDPIKI